MIPVAVAIVGGLIIRIVLIKGSVGVLDSDEAVVGLMARHILSGHFRAFFWGQNYGGTIETALTAGVFWVFGSSAGALKSVPLVLSGVAAVLVWRVATRLMPPTGAVAAGLVVWLWPANYIWWSVKARGFYEATLCITLGCALIVLRLGLEDGTAAKGHRGGEAAEWAVLGALAGLGWWQTPQVAYILVPAIVWLVAMRRLEVWRAVAAVPAFALGALPWLVANVDSGFASLNPPPAPIKGTYVDHLSTFIRNGLPMTFGLKYVYLTLWIGTAHVTELLYLGGIVLVVVGFARRQPPAALLGLVVIAYPLLHAVLTLSSEVAEGRYTLFLMPWLAIGLVCAAHRQRAALAALLVVVLGVSYVGLRDLHDQTSPYAPDRRVPTSLTSLERSLDAHHVNRLWANYWIAYRVTFQTRERIIGASATTERFPPYNDAVARATDPAYVFIAGSRDVRRFQGWLRNRHFDYAQWSVGTSWVVFVPHADFDPLEVPGIVL